MRKTIQTSHNRLVRFVTSTPALAISACLVMAVSIVPIVRAQSIQSQINALNNQNSQVQSNLNNLQLQASSYQSAINQLQTQIADIQAAISASQTKQAQLQQAILQDQADIAHQKQVMGQDIKAMYLAGQMTTIEELATSKNLSAFVDAQTYRNAVESKIQDTLNQITQLEAQQQEQQKQVQVLLEAQQAQNTQLTADQQQQSNLLSMNQAQQSQYTQQLQANNAQIDQLRAEQAAANASIAGSVRIPGIPSDGAGGACDIGQGNGGYPMNWCNAPQDAITDSNGFPNRECTSFAYWYFTSQEGQSGFQVSGNAGWWWETSSYPITTWNSSVVPGALGIEPSSSLQAPVPSLHGGYYGHVMIVLALPGTTYDGHFPHTAAAAGITVPQGDVLVMSMNEDEAGHFMYNFWPVSYLIYVNPK